MTSMTLAIDGGGGGSSLALGCDGELLALQVDSAIRTGEETFSNLLEAVLKEVEGETPTQILLVDGPGSYTGLRMALSFAQGLALGWNVPIAIINRFALIAHMIRLQGELPESSVISFPLGRGVVLVAKSDQLQSKDTWRTCEDLSELSGEALYRVEPTEGIFGLDGQLYGENPSASHLLSLFEANQELFSLFPPAELGAISPEYGLEYHALTVKEQQRAKRSRKIGTLDVV